MLGNVGMTRIDPVNFQGQDVLPIQFLAKLLPDPASLGPLTKGKTCIGDLMRGLKDGKEKTVYVYNICDHEECYAELGSQAIFVHHGRARHDRHQDGRSGRVAQARRVEHGAV